MADEIPVSEVRRVVIEYEIRVPTAGAAPIAAPGPSERDIVDVVRRELIRIGNRNGTTGIA
jgi:hypothetical protein